MMNSILLTLLCGLMNMPHLLSYNINEGTHLSRGYIVDIIPTWESAWYVSFEVNPLTKVDGLSSLIHFTTSQSKVMGGLPSVFLHYGSSRLLICSEYRTGSNSYSFYDFYLPYLPFNKYTQVSIMQTQRSDTSYYFEVFIDGQRKAQRVFQYPRYHADVKVYRANPWHNPSNALIRNLVYGNLPNVYHKGKSNGVVKSVRLLFPEFYFSVDVKPAGANSYYGASYILRSNKFTLYIQHRTTRLYICYNYYYYHSTCFQADDLPFDKFTNVQFVQTCIDKADNKSCTRYKYSVAIDGTVLRSGFNARPVIFRNLYVYYPYSTPANVLIKNLAIKTSSKGGYRNERNMVYSEIPHMMRQWYLSLDIMPNGTVPQTSNILHATLGGNLGRVGDRIPGIWFLPSSTRLLICSAVNGNKNYCFNANALPLNEFTNVQIRQALDVSINKYRYTISINDIVVHSVIHVQPQEFDDVFLFTSDPWYPRAQVLIRNIVFKNIPHGYTYAGCKKARKNINDTCFGMDDTYRSVDGSCNNFHNTHWGASQIPLRRLIEPSYAKDGLFDTPRGFPGKKPLLPPPNAVSEQLFDVERMNTGNEKSISTLFMTFGQFLDHDMVMTPHSPCNQNCDSYNAWQYPCFPLLFNNESNACSPNGRSDAVCNTEAYIKPREQINQLSAFVDGSQIYGSQSSTFRSLKQHRRGLMRVNNGHLLPFSSFQGYTTTSGTCQTKGGCSLAGDDRVDENIALHSMHTLWVREHNRIAKELYRMNPHWNDKQLYETTRKIVIALWQHITYNEYVPILADLEEYTGYKPDIDPSIFNAFATAAFRYGHSLIPNEFTQLNNNFDEQYNPVSLQEAFFNRQIINSRGIEPTMFGLIGNMSNDVDASFSFAIARKLFIGVGRSGHLDLAALNIQRGRDHGLPGYNEYRKYCGLKPIESWSDIEMVMLPNVKNKFQQIYKTPDDIDLFAGGISENHLPYHEVGPTFNCIIKQQFTALRDGDRFYHENQDMFNYPQLYALKKVTMASILCNNLKGIISIQPDVFHTLDCKNDRKICASIPKLDLSLWRDTDRTTRPPTTTEAATTTTELPTTSTEAPTTTTRAPTTTTQAPPTTTQAPPTTTQAPPTTTQAPPTTTQAPPTTTQAPPTTTQAPPTTTQAPPTTTQAPPTTTQAPPTTTQAPPTTTQAPPTTTQAPPTTTQAPPTTTQAPPTTTQAPPTTTEAATTTTEAATTSTESPTTTEAFTTTTEASTTHIPHDAPFSQTNDEEQEIERIKRRPHDIMSDTSEVRRHKGYPLSELSRRELLQRLEDVMSYKKKKDFGPNDVANNDIDGSFENNDFMKINEEHKDGEENYGKGGSNEKYANNGGFDDRKFSAVNGDQNDDIGDRKSNEYDFRHIADDRLKDEFKYDF